MLSSAPAAARQHERGSTIVELLVVLVVLGILSAIAIPTYLNQRGRAYDAGAKADLRQLVTLQEAQFTSSHAYTAAVSGAGAAWLSDYRPTAGVRWAIAATPNRFCIETYHSKAVSGAVTPGATGVASTFFFDSNSSGAIATSCGIAAPTWSGWQN